MNRHDDGTICGLSLDDTACDHTEHKPCSICFHPYGDHFTTNNKRWSGCAECNACEGYEFYEDAPDTCFDCGKTIRGRLERVPFGDGPDGYYHAVCYQTNH